MTTLDTASDLEPIEDFRHRARVWLAENVPLAVGSRAGYGTGSEQEELADVARNRELQRLFYDGGFAGLTFPKEYDGQGLTPAHQLAFNEELTGYESAWRIQVPTFQPCAAIILEFGTEEQKKEHLPKIFKGEAIWMQLLSEPSGGSDVASAQTSAVRDGDEWVINGSKIWTTGAWWSDWGLALVRTNWEVPKHRGLSVFVFELHQPAIEIHQIEMLSGAKEFCQEFITDLRVPDSARIGAVDDGWTIGIRWMYHERSAMAGSPFVTRPAGQQVRGTRRDAVLGLARRAGKLDDPRARELVGESYALDQVGRSLSGRLGALLATRQIPDQAVAIGRLMGGTSGVRRTTIAYEIAGASAGVWDPDDDVEATLGQSGIDFLQRQVSEIAGGTTEMSRNVISERVLGMPRERTLDKDVPFKDVPKGPPASR